MERVEAAQSPFALLTSNDKLAREAADFGLSINHPRYTVRISLERHASTRIAIHFDWILGNTEHVPHERG
jgi:hypothetical protein